MARDEYAEQGVDEILASIRKIIAVEDDAPRMPPPELPMRPQREREPADAALGAPFLADEPAPRAAPPAPRMPRPTGETLKLDAPIAAQAGPEPRRSAWSARQLADGAARVPPPQARAEAAQQVERWADGVQMPIPASGPASPFAMPRAGMADGPSDAQAPTADELAEALNDPTIAARREQRREAASVPPARRESAAARRDTPAAQVALSHPDANVRGLATQLSETFSAAESGTLDEHRMSGLREIWDAEQRADGRADAALPVRQLSVADGRQAGAASAIARPDSEGRELAPAIAERQPGSALEDAVKDLLRPMLREWLNENMPRLLAEAMREELGGGRSRR